ncbi:MAG: energy-coupling factor transporter transmembrane protein EcfT [Ruminococcaceae bacterium]|nr:energy-coupling factor transporter transmembrane protein EcfT [Oscillospiraceae bacterium]
MKNISFGQYYPADSVIHRMDPRAKVLMALFYIVCTFLCKNVLCFGVLILSCILLIRVAKLPLRLVLGTLKPLLFILLFTTLINVFMTKGETLLTPPDWRIAIYAEGLWNALFMMLRIVALLASTEVFLTLTTTPIALTDGLESLMSPLKALRFPVHDLTMIITIALRFIPTLMEETEKIMNAQRARGADFRSGGLIKRARALLPVFIPLLSSAFKRADELANAMDCRCYHGGEGRTKLKVLKFRPSDFVAVFSVVAFGVGILFLNRSGIGYTLK